MVPVTGGEPMPDFDRFDQFEPSQRDLILACAYLATLGLGQEEIKDQLDLQSQSQVSRYLSRARDDRMLVQRMAWPEDVDDDHKAAIEHLAYRRRRELLQLLRARSKANEHRGGVELQSVHVVPHARDLRAFGAASAPIVHRYLKQASTCAVAWGHTIESIALVLDARRTLSGPSRFVPVAGSPLNYAEEVGMSPTRAALTLSHAYGCEQKVPSLRGIPVRVPKKLADTETFDALEVFVHRSNAYEELFVGTGGDTAVMNRVDAILTGIGDFRTLAERPDAWVQEIIDAEREDDEDAEHAFERLRSVTVGNVGGVFLERPGADDPDGLVDGINRHAFGIKAEHVLACAQRAASDPSGRTPGVLVVAREKQKAEVVLEALGMVSRLIVSRELADELLEAGAHEAALDD